MTVSRAMPSRADNPPDDTLPANALILRNVLQAGAWKREITFPERKTKKASKSRFPIVSEDRLLQRLP
jgi:hypothetical protein